MKIIKKLVKYIFIQKKSNLSIFKVKQYIWQVIFHASVAQLDRAPDFGSGG